MEQPEDRFVIKSVPEGHISDDGSNLLIDCMLEGGCLLRLDIPYGQCEFLIQALLGLSVGAFQRQVALGKLAPTSDPLAVTQIAQEYQVLTSSSEAHAILQVIGRFAENAPLGLVAVQFSAAQLEKLGMQFCAVARQFKQRDVLPPGDRASSLF